MIRRALIATLAVACLGALAAPSLAAAAPRPAWQLDLSALPSAFAPTSDAEYLLIATNVGAAETEAGLPVALEATLPPGITPVIVKAKGAQDNGGSAFPCSIAAQQVSCQTAEPVRPGFRLAVEVEVHVEAAVGETLTATASFAGGGALQGASATAPTPISSEAAPFGFLSFAAPATDEDGLPVTAAGAHPHQLTLDMRLPVAQDGESMTGAGNARDIFGELPRGLAVDPAATPVRCTEAELLGGEEGQNGCPRASQIGEASVTSTLGLARTAGLSLSPLYNMVPPPGVPASLGFNAVNVGIYVHVLSGVRTDSDFGLYGYSEDVLALGTHPLIGLQLQLWGDPSAESHQWIRGHCRQGGTCPVDPQQTPFISIPGECPGHPLGFEAHADSWEERGVFKSAGYESSDLEGNPVSISGCNALGFEPTLSAQPTTNLADSPSGLDVDLHQPQEAPHPEPLSGRATAELKDATVTLPQGMAVNPSQADGLAACSEQEIGYLASDQEAGVHFSKQPQSCPDASKLGTVEVTSPLLAEYSEEGTKLGTDPETHAAIPRPFKGSVYLAKPFDNPFGSLLALYLVVEDQQSGIVAKLAGKVSPDPQTGRLTTSFEENPELPLEDVKLHLFGGARGALITPPTCATHTTAADLVPWSAPEGADAHPQSSFQITSEPGGGACPASEGAAPNAPSFTAGTESPQAGAYSPFVLKLSREDGSQRLTGIDTTLPPGLSGKLAGVAECSGAQIAQAEARSHPNEGILERESPSCPSASEVGAVTVGAGAGPTPYYTRGTAYLAGPYKGAPVSLAIITPAIAGPFDLGTVVVRTALYVNPDTAQIHAVSDPFPTILDGIPLDLRSVALKMDRPDFTLNPTSCNPLAITGAATSALGGVAALTKPFQVGGCDALPFKPSLSLRLKGSVKRSSTPRLIATVTAQPGEANVARAQVKLPHPVFLDQAHIRTICTRVQWTADTCPAGSVYGKAEATTPLLSYPLTGSVYLRSSSHPLPDLVAKLRGPASQPIEIDLDGKTDSVKAALRNTFEAVPDAPVSSFRLELFGGRRGLVEMSDGFCRDRHATVDLTGQNGKVYDTRPVVAAKCPRHKKGKAAGKGHHRS
jgi:hypothetical protein